MGECRRECGNGLLAHWHTHDAIEEVEITLEKEARRRIHAYDRAAVSISPHLLTLDREEKKGLAYSVPGLFLTLLIKYVAHSTTLADILPCRVTVVSILRLNTLKKYALTTNPTYDQYSVVQWSVVEVAIGMLCTCLPSMRLVLLRIWPLVFGQTPQPSKNQFSRQAASGQPSNNSFKSSAATPEYDLENTAILAEPPEAFYSATRGSWSVDLERVYSEASNRPHQERTGPKVRL